MQEKEDRLRGLVNARVGVVYGSVGSLSSSLESRRAFSAYNFGQIAPQHNTYCVGVFCGAPTASTLLDSTVGRDPYGPLYGVAVA